MPIDFCKKLNVSNECVSATIFNENIHLQKFHDPNFYGDMSNYIYK